MKKTLYLEDGHNDTKFVLDYELNKLLITIVIKKNDFWKNEFSKEYFITDEFYSEYTKLKEIEMIWDQELKDMEIIELNNFEIED